MRNLICLLFVIATVGFISAARAEDKYNDINGVILNEAGDPVPNATVRLMKRMGEDRELHMLTDTKSDKHGKFEFKKVAIGTFVVDAFKDDQHAMRHVDLADGDADLTIKLRPGSANIVNGKDDGYTSVDGIVRGEDKQPVRGAVVRLLAKNKEIDSVTTTSKGFFEFYKVADGTYMIEVTKGKLSSKREVTLKSGEKMDRLEFTFH